MMGGMPFYLSIFFRTSELRMLASATLCLGSILLGLGPQQAYPYCIQLTTNIPHLIKIQTHIMQSK